MPAAYWIAHVLVTDEARYGQYAKRATEVIPMFGGEFIVRGGPYEQLEGADRPRNVVARFPSLQAAHDCYHSPEYQAAMALAEGAATRELVIVEAAS